MGINDWTALNERNDELEHENIEQRETIQGLEEDLRLLQNRVIYLEQARTETTRINEEHLEIMARQRARIYELERALQE